jgi:hypothetical protein
VSALIKLDPVSWGLASPASFLHRQMNAFSKMWLGQASWAALLKQLFESLNPTG